MFPCRMPSSILKLPPRHITGREKLFSGSTGLMRRSAITTVFCFLPVHLNLKNIILHITTWVLPTFRSNDYQNAVSWFRRYLNLTREAKTRMVGDALNRIGDSYFILTRYETAIEFYDRSISNAMANRDYALFQKLLHQAC
jgi:tetratricopeptide (TPR) repeat protein